MRIYMDVCCFNRPQDDLAIGRNRLEAEAVLSILRRVLEGKWSLVGSEVVDAGTARFTPLTERRSQGGRHGGDAVKLYRARFASGSAG